MERYARGKQCLLPASGLAGLEIMSAFQRCVGDNPDMADQPYGGVLAKSRGCAYSCNAK